MRVKAGTHSSHWMKLIRGHYGINLCINNTRMKGIGDGRTIGGGQVMGVMNCEKEAHNTPKQYLGEGHQDIAPSVHFV